MLCGIVHNCRAKISCAPCPQCGAEEHQQRTDSDSDSRKRVRLHAAGRHQMPERSDERSVIENGQQESCEVNRAYDPEPFFELEPGRGHGASLAMVAISRNPRGQRLWLVALRSRGSK